MRKWALLVLFTGSTSALAWPSVNDSATYDVTITPKAGEVHPGLLEVKTTEIDRTQNLMTIADTSTFSGASKNEQHTANLEESEVDAQNIRLILSECATQGGTSESVETPAGTFPSCKVAFHDNDKSGEIWYADVVYGWVKQVMTTTSTGEKDEMVLRSYLAGE